ncbi:MAG: Crp/Fnr family transcriptional regulator [Gammaproteobacteria bacterium]|nr:Crp/Fnr family transcriptional regulator [Pseudomonadales bacterium]
MRTITLISTLQQNHLLAAISADSRSRLLPHMELVELPHGKVLHEIGKKIDYVYFPIDTIVAIVAMLENGDCTEVSMVGNEGLVGISSFMSGDTIPQQTVVRSAGYAYRIPATQLKDEFSRHGEMLSLLLSYTQTLITQTAQTAICNRHHTIEQQLCRILLQSLDRIRGDELTVTHENIATMLGVRRESVTEAAGRMKGMGLIECRRGRLKVLDRSGLESLCCECYRVVRNETERLLPRTSSFRRFQSQTLSTPSNR